MPNPRDHLEAQRAAIVRFDADIKIRVGYPLGRFETLRVNFQHETCPIEDAEAWFEPVACSDGTDWQFSHLQWGLLQLDAPALIFAGTEYLDPHRVAQAKQAVLAQIRKWEDTANEKLSEEAI